jgi:hypothetical protein
MAERHARAPAGKEAMRCHFQLGFDLRLECKHCGHPLIKNGAWFLTAAHFRREGCRREVTVTYSDKGALFDKHSHLCIVEGTALWREICCRMA